VDPLDGTSRGERPFDALALPADLEKVP